MKAFKKIQLLSKVYFLALVKHELSRLDF